MPAFGEHLKRFYPGMVPREEPVWRAWLKDHEQEFDSFEYNVHVGEGVTVPRELSMRQDDLAATMRETYRRATQLKIDAVGYRGAEAWIFEVEDRATNRTLGQLLAYLELLPRTRPGLGHTEAAVVARRVGPDMLDVFEEYGVVVFVVDVPA